MRILILVLLFIITGCNDAKRDAVNDDMPDGYGIKTIVINECQYIILNKPQGVFMIHAANCNNQNHTVK